MNQRQKKLLNQIIDDYIQTGQPVASGYLVKKYKLDISGATVRNDCQILEKEGYLTHPHTSAGRIPTEKGYQHFARAKSKEQRVKLKEGFELVKSEERQLAAVHKETSGLDERDRVKTLAKTVAGLAQAAVLVGFGKTDSYYTGLSYLFSQPEFQDHQLVYNISEIVDHLDEVLSRVYDKFPEEVSVKIGSENPFGAGCSFVGSKIRANGAQRFFGLLGPMRMPYLENMQRVGYVTKLLSG